MCLVGDESVICEDGGHMRCTGDVGRVLPGGGVVYVGRRDRQVKRRGHRVNLDYIQHVRLCVHCFVCSFLIQLREFFNLHACGFFNKVNFGNFYL